MDALAQLDEAVPVEPDERDVADGRLVEEGACGGPEGEALGDVDEVLELRVDVADRNGTTLTCPDSDLTCAQNAGSGCIQRLTWRVEVR